jgi:hypothetical protein
MTPRSPWFRRTLVRVLVIGPILAAGPVLTLSTANVHGNNVLYDFQGGLYNAGQAILHGHTPYQPGFLAHQAAIMRAGGIARGETSDTAFSIPVYPAMANLLVVPFSLLPFWLAGLLFTLLSGAAMLGGLWLLGVRDWRCMALVLISWPLLYSLFLGAVGPFLVLGAGVAWRWRDRIWPPALAIASIVAAKIFPWPLGVWLLITRRYKALAVTVAAGLVLTFGAWAVIGFDGLAQYPGMLSNMSFLQEGRAVSIVAVLLVGGVSPTVANVIAFALAGALLVVAWRYAQRPGGDRKAFGLAIIAALSATPIVWEHYMVLLFVIIALASPRLSPAWLIPLTAPLITAVSRVVPDSGKVQAYSPNALRTAILWLVLEGLCTVVLLTTPEQRRAFWTRLRSRPGTAPAPAGSMEMA